MFNPPRYPWADATEDPDQPVWPTAVLPQTNAPANAELDPTASPFTPHGQDHPSGNQTSNPPRRPAILDPKQNCSLYLTNLPGTTTVKTLLHTLAFHGPFDRIYSCHITPPNPAQHYYTTATAQLTTFTRRGAARLLHFITTQRGLTLNGRTANATWNRHITIPPSLPPHYTRVLHIHGPRTIVDVPRLYAFFRACGYLNLRPHTQDVSVARDADPDAERRTLVWRFAACETEALRARTALLAQWPDAGLEVRFGGDPCAVGVVGDGDRVAGWG